VSLFMFSVEVVCMSMEGAFWKIYVVERDRKTNFDIFLSMFLWEKRQRVLGILRLVVGGLIILSPKNLYLQWFKVRINNVCGQSTHVC
jgi:hypothetical protein